MDLMLKIPTAVNCLLLHALWYMFYRTVRSFVLDLKSQPSINKEFLTGQEELEFRYGQFLPILNDPENLLY